MGSTRLNQLGTLVLSSVILIMLITGCGKSPKDINSKPTPAPDQLNESNLSPVETPAPSAAEVATETISLYFSDKDLMKTYRIEKSIPAVDKADLPKAAVEEWIKGPEASYKDLVGILPPGVIVEYVKDIDGVANVSFSKEIKSANLGASGEAALLDQLSMVLQQFGFAQTQVLVEGHIEESLLGHMETNGPITANDPKDYEFMKGTAAGSSSASHPAAKDLKLTLEGMDETRAAALTLSDLGYYFYMLPNFKFTAEEPGKDLLYMDKFEEYTVRMELLTDDIDVEEIRKNTTDELKLIGAVEEMKGQEIGDEFFRNASFFLHSSNAQLSKNIVLIKIQDHFFKFTMTIPNGEASEGFGPAVFAMLKTIVFRGDE